MLKNNILTVGIILMSTVPAMANEAAFSTGPVFEDMGRVADVQSDMTIPKDASFAIDFDVTKSAPVGEVNRSFDTAARFINMHVAEGVEHQKIKIALVVHGKATLDLTNDRVYGGAYEGELNANKSAVKALTDKGVRIIVCGQSAVHYGVSNSDLLPDVEMALSAMTAHALLQQQGYTLNP